MSHYKVLEQIYLSAPVNQSLDLEIEVMEGEVLIKQMVKPEHCHTMGGVHGAYYFKCLDDACYFAANSIELEYCMLTVDYHIRFLRPITPDLHYIQASGHVVSTTKRLTICEGILKDSLGREIARGTGSFMPSQMRLKDYQG